MVIPNRGRIEMDDRNSSRLVIPNWIWAVTAFVFLFILGVVMWVGSSSSPQRIDVSERDYDTPNPPPINNYGSGQPYDIASSDVQNRSAAKVTVTPVKPEKTSSRPVGKYVKPNRSVNSVRDMFPVGPIVDSVQDWQNREPDASAARIDESFPEFTYGGRQWAFTGKLAASNSLDLAPIDADVDGRRVYSLAEGAASDRVLFVRSRTDPERYAVYRSTT